MSGITRHTENASVRGPGGLRCDCIYFTNHKCWVCAAIERNKSDDLETLQK